MDEALTPLRTKGEGLQTYSLVCGEADASLEDLCLCVGVVDCYEGVIGTQCSVSAQEELKLVAHSIGGLVRFWDDRSSVLQAASYIL